MTGLRASANSWREGGVLGLRLKLGRSTRLGIIGLFGAAVGAAASEPSVETPKQEAGVEGGEGDSG